MSHMPVSAVPLLDLGAQYNTIRESIEEAIREVCESQQFIGGSKVEELERRIADYSQCRFGIGVSSGTDALLVALMALDIGHGHEVITSSYSFFATGGVIARLGARPVFCDIEAQTYNLDPTCVTNFLQQNCRIEHGRLVNIRTGGVIKAIMPVHLFGQMADMKAFDQLSSEHDLSLIEDAAQAIGAALNDGTRAGSVGAVGCLSFFPSKNLGAFGDAGMCVTQSEELADKMRVLRVHGAKPKYHHSLIGGNFRLDALQAAILNVKLSKLDGWTRARQQHAAYYDQRFAELNIAVKTPFVSVGNRHIYNQYVIECSNRDELQSFLRQRNVGTEVYYPVPLHLQQCFRAFGYGAGDCPIAENAAKRTLALPTYPEMTSEQQDYVITQVAEFFAQRRRAVSRAGN